MIFVKLIGQLAAPTQTATPLVTAQSVVALFFDGLANLTVGEKPEKFKGTNFQRWQGKMKIYLTTLKLDSYLTGSPPLLGVNTPVEVQYATTKGIWHLGDYLCRSVILNNLDDVLYIHYDIFETAKEVWASIEKKYQDAVTMKFVRFMDYKMVDSKTMWAQIHELEVIMHEIAAEGWSLSEPLQVAAFIEKLPPGWKDFQNYLKHKRKQKAMTLDDLIVMLRNQEMKLEDLIV